MSVLVQPLFAPGAFLIYDMRAIKSDLNATYIYDVVFAIYLKLLQLIHKWYVCHKLNFWIGVSLEIKTYWHKLVDISSPQTKKESQALTSQHLVAQPAENSFKKGLEEDMHINQNTTKDKRAKATRTTNIK